MGAGGASSAAPTIEALSTLPQYVSGGDVLVEIRLHDDAASLKHLRIEANGRDVPESFQQMPDGSLRGLVDGLALGENEIVARANGGGKGTPPGRSATLRRGQPPDHRPAVLRPAAAAVLLRDRAGRARPAARRVLLRADAGDATGTARRPGVRRARRPGRAARRPRADDDVDGRTVDYIVRLERGTIDRGVYEIAALYDPAAPPSPFTAEPGWNERLVYTFGGGCNVGYHQGHGTGGVLTDLFLARGYAVASSSLNVSTTTAAR